MPAEVLCRVYGVYREKVVIVGLDCVTNQTYLSFCEKSMKVSDMLVEYIMKIIGYGAIKNSHFFQGIWPKSKMAAKHAIWSS